MKKFKFMKKFEIVFLFDKAIFEIEFCQKKEKTNVHSKKFQIFQFGGYLCKVLKKGLLLISFWKIWLLGEVFLFLNYVFVARNL